MSKEAMKLALEALENSIDLVSQEARNAEELYGKYPTRLARIQGLVAFEVAHEKAITALREALAEQPAQQDGPINEGWQITVANGHSGYGLYAHMEDYPEEGAVLVQTIEQPAQQEPDMFWNQDDAEAPCDSIEEFLNHEICNGYLDVGVVFTLLQAKRLPSVKIKVTSIDENECEAEYEIIEAAHGIKENT